MLKGAIHITGETTIHMQSDKKIKTSRILTYAI